jgi:hypothetical protein
MQREQILLVLRHWYTRQSESGPESAFRFRLVAGPHQKPQFAEYPVAAAPTMAEKRPAQRKNNKGKQNALSQLDRILPSSSRHSPDSAAPEAGPNPNPSPEPGPSTSCARPATARPSHPPILEPDVVRVNLGQVNRLREMGYQVHGPVNGPNEGLPEYLVPHSWLDILNKEVTMQPLTLVPIPIPIPMSSTARPYPRPRPIQKTRGQQNLNQVPTMAIDPLLTQERSNHPNEPEPARPSSPGLTLTLPPSIDNSSGHNSEPLQDAPVALSAQDGPAHPPVATFLSANQSQTPPPDPAPTPTPTGSNTLGKRAVADRSPQKPTHKARRKVVRDDALAMQEAQALLNRGPRTRARTKSNRKRR